MSCNPKPSSIAVCESWCKPGEPHSLYSLNGYNLNQSDCIGRIGGGTMIYVLSSLTYSPLSDHVMPSFESVWVELTSENQKIRIASLYRPPRSDIRIFGAELETAIKLHPNCPTLLLGDLNAKNSLWQLADQTDYSGDCINTLLSTYNFHQHIHFFFFFTQFHWSQIR